MSLALGPIHYWLYSKINIAESRAFTIYDAIKDAGIDVGDLADRYGAKLENNRLDDVIGDSPIHSFLQGLITKISLFEAQLVEAAIGNLELVYEVAEKHGFETGRKAAEKNGANGNDSASIARLINDHKVEGMPCDPGPIMNEVDDNKGLDYLHTACNHKEAWGYTSVDFKVMCDLNNRWVEGLVKGATGGKADYQSVKTIAGGDESCEAKILIG